MIKDEIVNTALNAVFTKSGALLAEADNADYQRQMISDTSEVAIALIELREVNRISETQ